MSVVTLVPNGVGNGGGTPNGAATMWQCLADTDDNTYVTGLALAVASPDYTTTTKPAGSILTKIELIARVRGDTATYTSWQPGLFFPSDSLQLDDEICSRINISSTTVAERITTITKANWSSINLSQSRIDEIRGFWTQGLIGDYGRLTYGRVRLTFAEAPSAPTWTAPPIALPPTTLRPVHTWTHNAGANGGSQTKYRVRVFTLAQATVGGFNPATSPSTLDTGVVTSSTNTWTPGSDLVVGTTYRSYVTTYATVDSIDQQSPWSAAREFRIVSVPVTSVDTVTPDPIPPSNAATIDWTNTLDNWNSGGIQSRYWVRVFTQAQYSIGGFDPETSPATFDSGNVTSSVSVLTTTELPGRGETYRAYVRVGQTTNGVVHYSSWAFAGFTTGGSFVTLAAGNRASVLLASGQRAVITLADGSVM